MNISKDKLLWLAGLLDAEGCFYKSNGGKPSPHGGKQMRVALEMTDLDIVEYVRVLIGHTGTVSLPKILKPQHKQRYRMHVNGEHARNLALAVSPYMSNRRREKVSYLTEIDVYSKWEELYEYQRYLWVSGYVEGEGCIHWTKHNNSRHNGFYMFRLATTDKDAVLRVGDALDLSIAYHRPLSAIKKGRKPLWLIQTGKQQTVYDIFTKLRPHVFAKKYSEIDEALTFFNSSYPECLGATTGGKR